LISVEIERVVIDRTFSLNGLPFGIDFPVSDDIQPLFGDSSSRLLIAGGNEKIDGAIKTCLVIPPAERVANVSLLRPPDFALC